MVPAKLMKRLVTELDELVKQGWYSNRSEAVRELVEKMRAEVLEDMIRKDIKWGLREH